MSLVFRTKRHDNLFVYDDDDDDDDNDDRPSENLIFAAPVRYSDRPPVSLLLATPLRC